MAKVINKGCKHCGGDLVDESREYGPDELKCIQCGRTALFTREDLIKEVIAKAKIEEEDGGEISITIKGYKCYRCRHIWIPRFKRHPIVCPKCHSPYWDRKRRKLI